MSNNTNTIWEENLREIDLEKFPDYLFSADNALSWVGQSMRDAVEVVNNNGVLTLC